MNAQPKIRLVSKSSYLYTLGWKLLLSTLAIASTLAALFFGCGILCLCVVYITHPACFPDLLSFVICAIIVGIGAFWVVVSNFFIKQALVVEKVAPITRKNAAQLPEASSLVRASDLPFAHQQTELLRAVLHNAETPAEELLRSSDREQEISADVSGP